MDVLEELLATAKRIGFAGVALVNQGGGTTPYLAAVLDSHGHLADPRNWNTQPTPAAALTDLLARVKTIEHHSRPWAEDFGTPAVSVEESPVVEPIVAPHVTGL